MNELVTTFGTDNFEDIAKETGAFSSEKFGLPNLKINRESEDDQGNALAVGTYFVSQEGVSVFSKTAKFRPFLNTYQYMVYDAANNKFTNKSIIFKSFNEQAIDELGGVRCGKISAKELLSLVEKGLLSDSEKIAQKAIKCYRGIYGLLTMPDTDVTNLPVLWRMSGDSFNATKEALDSITKMRHICFQHWLNLDKPERKKQGSNVWYTPVVQAILDKTVEFSTEDMQVFQEFKSLIERENSAVAEKWRNSKRNLTAEADINIINELDLNDSIDDL